MRPTTICLALSLSLFACGGGDDDDDDDSPDAPSVAIDASADAPVADGALADAAGPPDVAPPDDGPPDAASPVDAWSTDASVDISAACTHICTALVACYPDGDYTECVSGCSADLADCTAAQVDAVGACAAEPCEGDAVINCLMAIPCLEA